MGAAGADHGRGLGIASISAERDVSGALSAIARAAQQNKIVSNHCAAICFRNNVAAIVSVPSATSCAAIKTGENCIADRSGDAGFFGHDVISKVSTITIAWGTHGVNPLFALNITFFVHDMFSQRQQNGTKRERKKMRK